MSWVLAVGLVILQISFIFGLVWLMCICLNLLDKLIGHNISDRLMITIGIVAILFCCYLLVVDTHQEIVRHQIEKVKQ